jgi:hypothetical protein
MNLSANLRRRRPPGSGLLLSGLPSEPEPARARNAGFIRQRVADPAVLPDKSGVPSGVPGWRFRGDAGFTMVEIAICIAVVAFALVAIIGVLPTGLQVQKQNREETIIQQEGQFWLETLRSGAVGLDYLTNYVDLIHTEAQIQLVGDNRRRVVISDAAYGTGFRNGRDIVGLLGLPKWHEYLDPAARITVIEARRVLAFVRGLTGSAAEKVPGNDFAFTYRLTPELSPLNPVAGMNTNFNEPLLATKDPFEWQARSNLFVRARLLRNNAYELRLTLEWPVYQTRAGVQVGNNRKTFRTLVSGRLWYTNVDYLGQRDLFFVQPAQFNLEP